MPPTYADRRFSRGARILALALMTALLLAACGNDGPSKEEFIAEADPICAEAEEQARALEPPLEAEQQAAYAEDIERITQEMLAELRAMDRPEEDADTLDQLLTTIGQANEHLVAAYRAQAAGGNPAEDFSEALHLTEDTHDLATEYGFTTCGISAGTEG